MPLRFVSLPAFLLRLLLRFALLGLACLGLASTVALDAGTAWADAYTKVERTYAETGTIPDCRFSSSQLEAALRETPTYDLEYFGDFTSALHTVLTQQAGGRCSHRGPAAGSLALGPGPGGSLALPSSATSSTSAGIPAPLLLTLAILLAGIALAAILSFARLGGWGPPWTRAARHAWLEAEYRVAGTWSEFRDRLRS
jgi:hypothetical protein